jgi:hypothetical protein
MRFGKFRQFVRDAGRWGVTSISAGVVACGFLVWEHTSGHQPVPEFWAWCLIVLLFCLGAGVAWDKKREELAKELAKKSTKDDSETAAPTGDVWWQLSEKTQFFLTFSWPEKPTPEERKLATDIVILDHRAHHRLKPKTEEWDEVLKLLINAVVFLQARDAAQGRAILEEAQLVYYHDNQTKNRIRYLAGAVAGILAAAAVALGSLLLSKSFEQYVGRQLLLLIFVFAGLGSIASVLTRVSTIDLRQETSSFSVVLSGFSRPLIAIFVAVVVYFILDTRMIDVKLGSPTESKADAVYLVTSFLCGFSERFAKDIISRVPFGTSGKENDQSKLKTNGEKSE